jgi:ribose 5-phosphate isomerase B
MMNKIVIGNDHGGFQYKEIIKNYLTEAGYEVIDMGTESSQSVDYPDFAKKVSETVVQEKVLGILICGTGIGVSIAANKMPGIRAALCHDTFSAKMARRHNDSNVLALGQRVIGEGLLLEIVETWLNEEFEHGRHEKRIDKITAMEDDK